MPYIKRRKKLLEQLPNNSMAVLTAAQTFFRSADVEYEYRQESNFYYLSGFTEPDSVIVLIKESAIKSRQIIFAQEKNSLKEVWHGKVLGYEQAGIKLGFAETYSIAEFSDILQKLLLQIEKVYLLRCLDSDNEEKVLARYAGQDNRLTEVLNLIAEHNLKHSSIKKYSLLPILAKMRMLKESHEIELMRKAAQISSKAHIEAIKRIKPGVYEYELAAMHKYHYAKENSVPAYPIIAGSGENALILHYIKNSRQMRAGELVLIDAGCEYKSYAADITRTLPVNGKFSAQQKLLYNVVLKAQLLAIELTCPGVTLSYLHNKVVEIIVAGLLELNILTGSLEENIAQQTYKKFYMHSTSHWLGLDVHDMGYYKQGGTEVELEPGMVFTVEPGLYIPAIQEVEVKWHNIGIRIEDDILVTANGAKSLSAVPKTVEEIEDLMQYKCD